MGDTLWNYFFSAGFIATVIVFLGKYIINNIFSKDMEHFKAKMNMEIELKKTELNKDIESYKSIINKDLESYKLNLNREIELDKAKLNQWNIEFQIKYSAIQSGRIETIKELYSKIVDMDLSLEDLLKLFQPIGVDVVNQTDIVINKGNELQNYYWKHKIYFKMEVCSKIDDLLNKYKSLFEGYKIYKDNWEQRDKMYFDEFKGSSRSIKQDLEEEFRNILGV